MDEDLKRNPTPTSPSNERRRIEHDIEIEDRKYETEIQTCCSGTTDFRLIKYMTQLSISMGILVFSCIQLVREVDNESYYTGLISLIVGIYINPTPTIKKNYK